ncbi:MAG: NRDE family protein [Gammaproteobacteria bacterium]|nr:NRDE family protein [Gammaproteobacteria bacterium]
MCLIAFAWRAHPRYPLLLVGNRDEFHARPTASLDWWSDAPDIAGGRDLAAGGTWLAISRNGRFGALTNFRDPAAARPQGPSRGELVPAFLRGDQAPIDAAREAATRGGLYSGFNLLLCDGRTMAYASNCPEAHASELAPGVYGLSNHRLDTPWPKLDLARTTLAQLLAADHPDADGIFEVVSDRAQAPDHVLPDTGVGLALEQLLSAQFIVSPAYGTRSSTLLMLRDDGEVVLSERSYGPAGTETGRRELRFSVAVAADP